MPARPLPPAASQAPADTSDSEGSSWAVWLAATWLVLLVLAVAAELGGLENLRLALDLQRHFAPSR